MSIDRGADQADWYIYTMEYYSAIKRDEIPTFLATWMDLETIMLSEVSHIMRHQRQMLSVTCGIWIKDTDRILTHRLWNTYGFQRRYFGGWGDALGLWNGKPIKLEYDDHCTTINVVNALSNIKKKKLKAKEKWKVPWGRSDTRFVGGWPAAWRGGKAGHPFPWVKSHDTTKMVINK